MLEAPPPPPPAVVESHVHGAVAELFAPFETDAWVDGKEWV